MRSRLPGKTGRSAFAGFAGTLIARFQNNMATYLAIEDVLNVVVSCFANYDTPSNPRPINMYSWLTNAKYRDKVLAIRAEADKAKRTLIKATLPAITPSGEFTYRRAADLVRHSRLLQFDIDWQDNPHIRNYAQLKAQIAKLPFVAYCGLSVSGTGYWGLVPIAYPERHGQHFDALKRVFAHYKIKLDDKPRNVASLRGYSYDPGAYFAQQVMLFELYDEPKPQPARSFDYSKFNDLDDSELLTRLVRYVEGAGEGQRHEMLLKASRLAGGYIAAGRLDEQTAVYGLETIASEWPMYTKSQKTIRDGIKYGLTAPIYPEERTTPLKIKSKTRHQPTGKTGKSPDRPVTELANEPMERVEITVIVEDGPASIPQPRQIVKTIAEQLANPGSLLRPDFEYLPPVAGEDENFPEELLNEPTPPGTVPMIKQQSYFEWQRQHPDFSKLGLASLPNKQQP